MESPRLRTDTSLAHEAYHHENTYGSKITLDGNLFTNAFVTALGLPSASGKEPPRPERLSSLVGATGAMVLVTIIQLLMAWTVYLHVKNDLIETKTRPLETAFEMFIGTNITIPLATVEQLCGQWEDQEMKEHATGPLSTMNMPDGSVYAADDSYSLFYNLKQPTRSWDYGRLGSERSVIDDVMFVLSEGVSLNPLTPSGYSLLFILMIAIFFFAIFVEVRQLIHFAGMLIHFCRSPTENNGPWKFDKAAETFELVKVTPAGQVVGVLGIICRLAVAICLLCLGTVFLLYTSLKIDLILNGLAILFVLELDKVIYSATVPARLQKFVDDVAPIAYRNHGGKFTGSVLHQIGPVLLFPITFLLAVGVRAAQCSIFTNYFRMTAAICLLAGPTTPFARRDIVSPVAGFCDSLLGISCAPHVTPNETATKHGYCIVTDQTTLTSPSVQFYLDDPTLFTNRYNDDGSTKSWADWGVANPRLYKSDHWMDGPYQDLLRKNCLQLYQKTTKPDDVLVDDDVGETMDGAPFWCAREQIVAAVFGDVEKSVDKMPTGEVIWRTKSLRDPDVIRAIDNCKVPSSSDPPAAPISFQLNGVDDGRADEPDTRLAQPRQHGRRVPHLRHAHRREQREMPQHKHHAHHDHHEVAAVRTVQEHHRHHTHAVIQEDAQQP